LASLQKKKLSCKLTIASFWEQEILALALVVLGQEKPTLLRVLLLQYGEMPGLLVDDVQIALKAHISQ
jgi:hypothetical protein